MNQERWLFLESTGNVLTEEEISEGWHYCYDWDDMLIGPIMPEWDACICDIKKRIEDKIKLKDSRIHTDYMTYSVKKGKYIVYKDSAYYSLTKKQVFELNALTNKIIEYEGLKND